MIQTWQGSTLEGKGTREIAQLVKCLLCKLEDLNLLGTHVKRNHTCHFMPVLPELGNRWEGLWGLLVSQPDQLVLQAQ